MSGRTELWMRSRCSRPVNVSNDCKNIFIADNKPLLSFNTVSSLGLPLSPDISGGDGKDGVDFDTNNSEPPDVVSAVTDLLPLSTSKLLDFVFSVAGLGSGEWVTIRAGDSTGGEASNNDFCTTGLLGGGREPIFFSRSSSRSVRLVAGPLRF